MTLQQKEMMHKNLFIMKSAYKPLLYTFIPFLIIFFLLKEAYEPLGKIAFPAQYFLNILYFKRTKYFKSLLSWRDVGIRILAPAFLLLFSINSAEYLKEIKNHLEYIAPVKGDNFEELRKSLLYAYERYFLQKLI